MWKIAIALLLIGVICANSHTSPEVRTIDQRKSGEEIPFDEILRDFCEATLYTKTFKHPTTIGRLIDYFDNEFIQYSETMECRKRNIKYLKELRFVVETSSHNVCSREKMELINEFHWKYIVNTLSHQWRKVGSYEEQLPEVLRLFFLHYANDITEKCKETLPERLELTAGHSSVQSESLFSNKFGKKIDELRITLVPQSEVKNYDSFFFLWDQLIAREQKKGHTLSHYIDDLTDEQIFGLIKVKDPSKVWQLQNQCRLELRPIYQDTVLPVMKLLGMGYGKVDEKSGEIVRGNELIKNWYAIAQICELLIPMNFYQDDSLKEGEGAILSTFGEAENLKRPTNLVRIQDISSNVNIKPVQLEDSLLAPTDYQIVKTVKTNLKDRSKLFRQFFKNIFASMKGKLSSKLKNFFLLRKTEDNKQVKESGEKIIEESEHEIRELLEEEDADSPSDKTMKDKRSMNPFKRFNKGKEKKEKRERSPAEIQHQVRKTVNIFATIVFLLVATGLVVLFTHG